MQKRKKLIPWIIGGITGFCGLCVMASYVFSLTPAGRAAQTERAIEALTETARPTNTSTPTRTQKPTNTSKPTNTEKPTSTITLTRRPSATHADTNTPRPTSTTTNSAPVFASIGEGDGFRLVSFSATVVVGSTASAQISTFPGAKCQITYTTPSGTESSADGLGQLTAKADGSCIWIWKIGTSTKPGKGKVRISANDQTQTFDIEIIK